MHLLLKMMMSGRLADTLPTLNPPRLAILSVLSGVEESYNAEIVESSGGALRKETLYPLLVELEEANLIVSRYEDDEEKGMHRPGRKRRLFRITERGERVFQGWLSAMMAFLPYETHVLHVKGRDHTFKEVFTEADAAYRVFLVRDREVIFHVYTDRVGEHIFRAQPLFRDAPDVADALLERVFGSPP